MLYEVITHRVIGFLFQYPPGLFDSNSDFSWEEIDRINPTLTVNGYDGTVFKGGDFVIDGKVNDTLNLSDTPVTVTATRDGTSLTLDPVTITAGADGKEKNWSVTIPGASSDGIYTVVIDARDAVGRAVSTTKIVKVDNSAPTLSDISLNNDAKILGNSLTVTGSASEVGVAGLSTIFYSLNSGTA